MIHPSRRNSGPATSETSPAPADGLWSDRVAALAEANRGNRVVNPRPYNSRRIAPSLDQRVTAVQAGGAQ